MVLAGRLMFLVALFRITETGISSVLMGHMALIQTLLAD